MAHQEPRLEDIPASSLRFVGREVQRIDDVALVTGSVEFIDNVTLPGMLHGAILRSSSAHARIRRIDTSRAERLEGVIAVITGEDVRKSTNPSGGFPEGTGAYCIATDKVHYVGEPIAAVAAVSRHIAEDALELIEVELEPLVPVADTLEAMKPGSPLVIEALGSNVVLQKQFTWGPVAEAFSKADRVFEDRFRWHRMGANPMETFGCICQWDAVTGMLNVRGSTQSPLLYAMGAAGTLGIPTNRINLTSTQRGGSFGGKGNARGIAITSLLSRRAGGRPVKWIEDRMEYLTAGSSQAWDRYYEARLAVRTDGVVTAFHVKLIEDIGSSGEGYGAMGAGKPLSAFTGCYAIPAASYDLTLVLSNKVPTTAYRGMGPPPHFFVLEQMMDLAARGLGLDPAEIRRRNYIRPEQFPYIIPSGNEYDSGEYEATLDRTLGIAGYRGIRQEQERARAQGRLIGIGIANTVEPGVFDWNAYAIVGMNAIGIPEGITVSIDAFGRITARVGFTSEGQGQYTLIAQLLADYFGAEMTDIAVVPLNTLGAPPSFGPGGSRLGVAITGATMGAAGKLRKKIVKIAAGLLQTPAEKLEFIDGRVQVIGMPEASVKLADIAGVSHGRSDLLPPGMEMGLEATGIWTAQGREPIDDQGRARSYLTAANACHLVMVEIDRETGQVEILKYVVVDDCGIRLNPATVEGLTQGGVAQGVAAALLEEYPYSAEAQPRATTFVDYLLPSICEVPMTEKSALVTPSPLAPLGAKGCGEGALHTAPAAVMCAVNDALAPVGVMAREVPASPHRLWKLLREAKMHQE
ncbi:MAG: xanthine dehydrogenase family protein molybdopterin-binding subunit [Gammaproteobacteria bacterium]|nr:xanthine dehydrogenase family protein molybdopterin-binding subunit [Gammaproteobacteria bacterium]